MKKLFPVLAVVLICYNTHAQNVGIGKTTPTEKLDVNGNVNISGTIKANGVAGTTGQVLSSSGTGLSWISIGGTMGYKKCVPAQTSWVVPTGVTEIMVEVWGAGAGGAGNAGGISGSYGRTIKTVTPGTTINFTLGTGGNGQNGTTNPTAGSSTKVTFPDGSYLEAYGGYAPDGNPVTNGWIGYPSTGNVYGLTNYYLMPGNMGSRTVRIFGQKSSTIYTEQVFYGSGGAPVGLLGAEPVPGSSYYYENGVATYSRAARLPYIANPYYSSGGNADFDDYGLPGGAGYALIWWN